MKNKTFRFTLKMLLGIHMSSYDYVRTGYILACGNVNLLWRKWLRMRQNSIAKMYGLEIPNFSNIGPRLTLGHPYNITVNPKAQIGSDCILCKGCTIGSVRSGPRQGWPVIGDRVVVGINAFVCGGITVGNDVLIAANAFVDFDVPDNSLVIGNPGVIKYKEKASKDYL